MYIPEGLRGVQEPKIQHLPKAAVSWELGQKAVKVGKLAGVKLDPWQEFELVQSMGVRPDGNWAAFEVGLCAPRQNGKNGTTEVRELAGLFLLGERLIVHSAHEFDTSLEAFLRMQELIEAHADFRRRVKRIVNTNGKEGIILHSGQRLRYRARTKSGARGFSGDLLVFDEAMDFPEAAHGSMLPVVSARANPQIYYAASAVDKTVHPNGYVLCRLRQRAIDKSDDEIAYFEHGAHVETIEEAVTSEVALDPQQWANANPGLGIRITPQHIAREQRSMSARNFAVERLNIGDWPELEESDDDESLISVETWKRMADPESQPGPERKYAIDVRPDRTSSSIGMASLRTDNRVHGDVIKRKPKTEWLAAACLDIQKADPSAEFLYDEKSPTASLVRDLTEAGVKLKSITGSQHADAFERFIDLIGADRFRHKNNMALTSAVEGAGTRPFGDRWLWGRMKSEVDIAPLVAITIAASAVGEPTPTKTVRRRQW